MKISSLSRHLGRVSEKFPLCRAPGRSYLGTLFRSGHPCSAGTDPERNQQQRQNGEGSGEQGWSRDTISSNMGEGEILEGREGEADSAACPDVLLLPGTTHPSFSFWAPSQRASPQRPGSSGDPKRTLQVQQTLLQPWTHGRNVAAGTGGSEHGQTWISKRFQTPLRVQRTPESLHMHNAAARTDRVISQLNGERTQLCSYNTHVRYTAAAGNAARFILEIFLLAVRAFLVQSQPLPPPHTPYFILSLQQ